MKTRKVRKSKVADWRFLATVVLVMLAVSGGIIYYAARMQPPPTPGVRGQ
jgi:hypothetical protein